MRFSCCRWIVTGLVGLLFVGFSPTVSILTAADSPRDAFVKSWKGSRVVVKQVLYTLIYSERSPVGSMSAGKRAGLNVVTPFDGAYFSSMGDVLRTTSSIEIRDGFRTRSPRSTENCRAGYRHLPEDRGNLTRALRHRL